MHVARLDLADPVSVAAFVVSWRGPLHVLVNNAGVRACPEQYSAQGWELQFATNHSQRTAPVDLSKDLLASAS